VSWPYDLLGVPADADERVIRRAYVVALKKTRPDEDPEGFQALHEAYRAALERVGRNVLVVEPVATDETAEPVDAPPTVVVEHPPPLPGFDFEAFFAGLLQTAAAGVPSELENWLRAQPALWNLPLKVQTGHRMLHALYERQPPLPADAFDAALAFFDLDRADADIDHLYTGRLRHRLAVQWLLLPENAIVLGKETTPLRLILTRPFRFWQNACLAALRPNRAGQVVLFLNKLNIVDDDIPPPLRAEQVHFWRRMVRAVPIGRERLCATVARAVFALTVALLVSLALLPVARSHQDSWLWPLAFTAVLSAIGFAYIGWLHLLWWQGRPDSSSLGDNALRAAVVPFMVVASLALYALLGPDSPHGTGLAVFACVVSVARAAARLPRPIKLFQFHWVRLLLLAPLGSAAYTLLAKAGNAINWIDGLALVVWMLDLLAPRLRRMRQGSQNT
jgi:hypothetical protein